MDQDTNQRDSGPVCVRTLLVSDVHLGCKHARPAEFLNFIRQFKPDTLYIVGDFIDGWKINSGWHWSQECDDIIKYLVELASTGTRILYTPGNHDSFLRTSAFRSMLPASFPDVEVENEFIYETLRGWKFLVTHGDLFDVFETRVQWISKRSSYFYDSCLSMNRWAQRLLMNDRANPYGVCAWLKGMVKRGVKFISRYENKIMEHAKRKDCEGVICGHIHTPNIVHRDAVLYCNTGDWVENCTGLVENRDGSLELFFKYGQDRLLELPYMNQLPSPVQNRSNARPIQVVDVQDYSVGEKLTA